MSDKIVTVDKLLDALGIPRKLQGKTIPAVDRVRIALYQAAQAGRDAEENQDA